MTVSFKSMTGHQILTTRTRMCEVCICSTIMCCEIYSWWLKHVGADTFVLLFRQYFLLILTEYFTLWYHHFQYFLPLLPLSRWRHSCWRGEHCISTAPPLDVATDLLIF